MADREPKAWITINGRHIPIFEGQTKEQAAKSFFSKYKKGPTYDKKPDYDLTDAINENNDNSVKHHLKDGKLSDERHELHNKIVEDYFKDKMPYKEGDEKYAQFTGGGPASGKGGFVRNIDEYYKTNDNPVKVDADDIKKLLLKADTGKNELDMTTTRFYHEESSLLAKRIYDVAIQNNYPVLFDGTATSLGSLQKKLNLAEKHGYKTEMCFMTATPSTVIESQLRRYEDTGRLVDINFVLYAHTKAQSAVPEILNKLDNVKVYSRNGDKITLIATGGKSQQTTIRDQRKYDDFLKPDAYSLDTGALNRYNSEVSKITERRKKAGK